MYFPTFQKTVTLSKNGKANTFFIHRLVMEAFEGPANGKFVNHIDGDKSNNSICNLEWVTTSENHAHAYKTGLRVGNSIKGSQSPKAKLDETKVREIKHSSISVRVLAEKYRVHHSIIQGIKSGKRWSHVVWILIWNFLEKWLPNLPGWTSTNSGQWYIGN